MAGGIGGFVAFPYTHLLMELLGWKASLLRAGRHHRDHDAAGLAARRQAAAQLPASSKPQTLGEAFKEAFTHPSYLLLTAGFFVCGFHVAFYSRASAGFRRRQGSRRQRRRDRR